MQEQMTRVRFLAASKESKLESIALHAKKLEAGASPVNMEEPHTTHYHTTQNHTTEFHTTRYHTTRYHTTRYHTPHHHSTLPPPPSASGSHFFSSHFDTGEDIYKSTHA